MLSAAVVIGASRVKRYIRNSWTTCKLVTTSKFPERQLVIITISITTILPAKSDSDIMFCLQCYQGLRMHRSLVYLSYLQDRINTQVIY